jgi:ComF family protein
VAAAPYQGVVRRAVHELKFRQGRYLVPFLADLMAEAVRERPLHADLLVPVPLSADRQRRRGYNQAELLAGALLARAPLGGAALEPSALTRPRPTRPQFALDARERRANVPGAIACPRPELVRGGRVALLDDVCTTGATLAACAEALRAAGASRVMAIVAARDL